VVELGHARLDEVANLARVLAPRNALVDLNGTARHL